MSYIARDRSMVIITSAKEVMCLPALVCLFVCLCMC